MKSLFTLLFLLNNIFTLNPGLLLQLDAGKLNSVKKSIIPYLSTLMKRIELKEEMEHKEIDITHAISHALPIVEKDLTFTFKNNNLYVKLANVNISTILDVNVSYPLYNNKGKVRFGGVIDEITWRIGFKKFHKDNPKPLINVTVDDLKVDYSQWTVNLGFDFVPKTIADMIEKNVRDGVISRVTQENVDEIGISVREYVDQLSSLFYPTQYDSPFDISVISSLTGQPKIEDGKISIPVDGTFFKTSAGLMRSGEPEELDRDEKVTNLIELFISDYSFNTFLDSINGKELKISKPNYDINLQLNTAKNKNKFEDGRIKLNSASFVYTLRKDETFITIEATVNTELTVSNIDWTKKTFELGVPFLEIVKLTVDSSVRIIRDLVPLYYLIIYGVLYFKHDFTLSIPDIQLPFGLSINDANLEVLERDIKLGLDIQKA